MNRFLLLLLVNALVSSAVAALPPAEAIDQLIDDYFARRVARPYRERLTMEEALEAQRIFVKELARRLGPPVGYKVGLVSREAQRRWSVEQPVRGVLLEKMLLRDGAEVPANFAAAPLLEADLAVVVKDKGINHAATPLEVARHLKEVVAFIELPDAFLATNAATDGAMLAAANVGARLGVLGQRRPVKATREFVDALAEMTMVMTDEAGLEMGRGRGKAILDHPLNAVLWLIEDLNLAGESLKAGDLISLGSIQMMPAPAGHSVTVRYEGLPGGPIRVSMRLQSTAPVK